MSKAQKSAIVVGVSTAFVTTFAGSALNLAIPSMGNYFNMGAAGVGWIVTLYTLVIAAFSTPFGKLADSTGRRRILVIGVAGFGIVSIATIFAPNAAALLVLRVVQGIAASMIFATNMPIAISVFPGKERGKAIGLVTSGTYVGLAMGPVLGGILNNWLGWQAIFAFGACVSIFALTVVLKGVDRDVVEATDLKQDVTGNILYVVMIATFIYGLTSFNSIRFGWVFIAVSLAAGFLYVKTELKAENPMIDVRIFKSNMTYTLSNLTALFNYSATFALGYLVSIYLQVVMGFSSQIAGIILITQPFFMAILSPRMGKLSDKIAPYKLASAGMGMCALALLFFVFIKDTTPLALVIAALALAGIGIAFFSSPNTNVIMGCVPPAKFGVANSILATMRTTGQSSGMAIITLVVSGSIGNVSLYEVTPVQLIGTIHTAFIIFTVLCAAGIFMSLTRKHV
ncbi:MAG: MFS transporter [Firmicutes bacterium]|nr:MFS transporter [Bacillota bacterium]